MRQLRFEKARTNAGKKEIVFPCAREKLGAPPENIVSKRQPKDLNGPVPLPTPIPAPTPARTSETEKKIPLLPPIPSVGKNGDRMASKSPQATSEPIVVFTDGATSNNGKSYAKSAYAAVFPKHPHLDASAPLQGSLQTNNRAEYMAVIVALRQAQIEDPTYRRPLHIYTDSELLLKSATVWIHGWVKNGWKTKDKKPVKNRDLLETLLTLLSHRKVVWNHVKAHTGGKDWQSIWNDKADTRARAALRLS